MPVIPTGPFSLPLANCRRLMAASSAWQAWTRTTDATLAAGRIHYFDLPAPENQNAHEPESLQILRPCAVLSYINPEAMIVRGSMPSQHRRIAGGSALTFVERGTLFVAIEAEIPDLQQIDGESTDALIDFLNQAGAVHDDMLALSGTDDYLVIKEIAFSDPMRGEFAMNQSQGEFIKMLWRIDYGNFA